MDRNAQQLALLVEIDAFLRDARVRYWLRGGWALDFIMGAITRPHADIDLVSWKRHERRIRRLFRERGFQVSPKSASVDFRRDGVDVNVLFVVRGPAGMVHTAGFSDARWSHEMLSEPPRPLAGLSCRTVSARGLLVELEKTPGWLGRPPRPKDIETMEVLRRLVGAGEGHPPGAGRCDRAGL